MQGHAVALEVGLQPRRLGVLGEIDSADVVAEALQRHAHRAEEGTDLEDPLGPAVRLAPLVDVAQRAHEAVLVLHEVAVLARVADAEDVDRVAPVLVDGLVEQLFVSIHVGLRGDELTDADERTAVSCDTRFVR